MKEKIKNFVNEEILPVLAGSFFTMVAGHVYNFSHRNIDKVSTALQFSLLLPVKIFLAIPKPVLWSSTFFAASYFISSYFLVKRKSPEWEKHLVSFEKENLKEKLFYENMIHSALMASSVFALPPKRAFLLPLYWIAARGASAGVKSVYQYLYSESSPKI